jgi:Ca2+-dependent lipid-binding protein
MSGKGMPKGKLNYTIAFYPALNVIDPEEEEEEQKAQAEMENKSPSDSKQTSPDSKPSLDAPKSLENGVSVKPQASLDAKVAPALTNGVKEGGGSTSASMISAKKPPKVRINVEDLNQYRMFVSEMEKIHFANPMVQNPVSLFSTLLKELLPKRTSGWKFLWMTMSSRRMLPPKPGRRFINSTRLATPLYENSTCPK